MPDVCVAPHYGALCACSPLDHAVTGSLPLQRSSQHIMYMPGGSACLTVAAQRRHGQSMVISSRISWTYLQAWPPGQAQDQDRRPLWRSIRQRSASGPCAVTDTPASQSRDFHMLLLNIANSTFRESKCTDIASVCVCVRVCVCVSFSQGPYLAACGMIAGSIRGRSRKGFILVFEGFESFEAFKGEGSKGGL